MNKPISEHHEQIGKNIQQYRKKHRLTEKDLSRSCHIPVEQLKRMERGEVNFRLTTLVKLMRLMGVALFPVTKKS